MRLPTLRLRSRRARYGVALGLRRTGAGLAVAELVAGLIGAASPVVPVGQEFIDRVPRSSRTGRSRQFGTADKVVLVAGALIVVLALGSMVGILATAVSGPAPTPSTRASA